METKIWEGLTIKWTNVTPEYLNNFFIMENLEPGYYLFGTDAEFGSGHGELIRIPLQYITEFGFNKELDNDAEGIFVRTKWRDTEEEKEVTYYLIDFQIVEIK